MLFLDTVEGETALLQALLVHRPFGADKHWAMIGIQVLLAERNHGAWVKMPSGDVWRKLEELYDGEVIEEQVSSLWGGEGRVGKVKLGLSKELTITS